MKHQIKYDPTRFGAPILTFSGTTVYPLDPKPNEILIVDIAHALSRMCRFNGHIQRDIYSVAEHSMRVVDRLELSHVPREVSLWGLLHDASEAYLADIVKPAKDFLPDYLKYEKQLMDVIAKRFGLPVDMPAKVHEADRYLYTIETEDLRGPIFEATTIKRTLSPATAEKLFLEYFYDLQ